jgi:NAD(P)-dependent dehydrogenase (short-subunit alcohol dehydrogenase family)
MSYSIIGFGAVGQALARAFARRGIEVAVASRQAPDALLPRARAIGPTVKPTTLQEAVRAQTLILAVPFWEHRNVAKLLPDWQGKTLIDATNAFGVPIDYGMTKTAMLAVSRALAELVAGTGVTVNAVLPGPTNSEIVSNWMNATAQEQGITQEQAEQQFLKTLRPTSLINRFATTNEVANMVVYTCSEQASATTGSALRVDGGVVRSIA